MHRSSGAGSGSPPEHVAPSTGRSGLATTPFALSLPSGASLQEGIVVLALVVSAITIAVLWRRRGVNDRDRSLDSPGGDERDAEGIGTGSRPEPMDDRDRVRGILRENGGRTRQSVLVEETGWSKAKVSAVLAEMDADDELSKLRVGRENLVSLPGHEPEATNSPHED